MNWSGSPLQYDETEASGTEAEKTRGRPQSWDNGKFCQEKRRIQSVKRKAASSQDQEATKEDIWSSNPSVEEDDRTQSCYKKGGTFESEFWQQKTFDT
jgi:hypothetical protein